jgi:hypothetical protein
MAALNAAAQVLGLPPAPGVGVQEALGRWVGEWVHRWSDTASARL